MEKSPPGECISPAVFLSVLRFTAKMTDFTLHCGPGSVYEVFAVLCLHLFLNINKRVKDTEPKPVMQQTGRALDWEVSPEAVMYWIRKPNQAVVGIQSWEVLKSSSSNLIGSLKGICRCRPVWMVPIEKGRGGEINKTCTFMYQMCFQTIFFLLYKRKDFEDGD